MIFTNLLHVLESLAYLLGISALLLVSVLPLGFLLISRLKTHSPHLKLVLSLALGSVGLAAMLALVFFLHKLGMPLVYGRVLCFSCLVLLFTWSICSKSWLSVRHGDVFTGAAVFLSYFALCLVSVLFPDVRIEDAAVNSTMFYSDLPIDLFIPFNLSRFILEGFDPSALDVVPGWGVSDRGPLLGLITAFFFLLTDVGETDQWLATSSGPFFFYQVIAIFLNALSLLAVWLFSCRFFSRSAASYACLALVSTHFYFLNTFFAWPKFYMAFLLLASLWVWFSEKNWLIAGILAGSAVLAHDSAIFVVAAFLVFSALQILIERGRGFWSKIVGGAIPIGSYLLGFLLLFLPWSLVKIFWVPPSPRLLYMHLFCYLEEDLGKHTFGSLLNLYLEKYSLLEIIGIRLSNLIYPINPLPAVEVFSSMKIPSSGEWLFKYLNNVSFLVFFQTYLAAGVFFTVLFFYSLYLSRKEPGEKMLVDFSLITAGSVFFLVLISGCHGNIVNHIWAYPFFLVGAICLGNLVSKGGLIVQILFALGVGSNLFLAYFYMHYRPVLKPFLHASPLYLQSQLVLGLLTICLLIFFSRESTKPAKDS